MRQVIRADLDPRSRPARRPRRGRSRAGRQASTSQGPRRKPRKRQPFRRRRRCRPGRGRAEGQEGDPLFFAGAGLALLDACPAPRPALRRRAALRAWRFRAPRPRPRSCASTPTKARCATCASPSATRSALPAKLLQLWRDLAGRPPSLDAGRLADAAAALDLSRRRPRTRLAESL